MNCICPECKNSVDLSKHPQIAVGHVIECNTCGIMLGVTALADGLITTEIVDEGK